MNGSLLDHRRAAGRHGGLLAHAFASGILTSLTWLRMDSKLRSRARGMAQVVQHLPGMNETLGSIPKTAKKKREGYQRGMGL
jgi:hypothetical protein